MNQKIKVTKCSECPFIFKEDGGQGFYSCNKRAFCIEYYADIVDIIHPNCPLKGKSITYKIGESNE